MMARLTNNPNISSSANGTTFARFGIAVDRRFKREGDADADFFNCTAFGKTAEFVEHYLHKGTKVVVSGRLENNNYTAKDGHKVYDIRIMVEEIEFAESKSADAPKNNDDFLKVDDLADLPFA